MLGFEEESMSMNATAVSEAASRYIASLPHELRFAEQLELNKFVWWFGSERRLDELTGLILEQYQTQVEDSGADQAKRLAPVKSFLTFAHKQGYLSGNLAKFIKLKRAPSGKRVVSRGTRSQNAESEPVQLTAEGYAKMKKELEHLITVVRPQVAQEILEARRDKDIRENAPYDAAKQHQAHVEARIRELERIVGSACVIDERSSDRVAIGCTVVLRDLEADEEVRYMLVSPDEVNPLQGKISTASPVGKALLDREAGEIIEVNVPAGIVRYRLERLER